MSNLPIQQHIFCLTCGLVLTGTLFAAGGCSAPGPDLRTARESLAAGQWEDAIQRLDEVIRQFPQSADALILRGQAALRLHQFQSAIADLEHAGTIDPTQRPYGLLAEAYLGWGDFELAEQAATAAPEKSADLLVLRGRARLGQTKLALAEEDFTQALQLSPQDPNALLYLGATLLERGQYAPAEQQLTQLINMRPSHARAYVFRALAREKLGRSEAAESDRSTAQELDPSLKLSQTAVGESLLRSVVNEHTDLRPLSAPQSGANP